MSRLINRTNEPGTCPWCGHKLAVTESAYRVREVPNPEYEKQMREWEAYCQAAPEGSLLRRSRQQNPPSSVLHEHYRERVPARNHYAPFCSLRCGHAFGRAAYKNDFRLQPYTETEEQS